MPSLSPPLASRSLEEVLAARQSPSWIPALRALVGDEAVRDDPAALWVYSRDRSPFAVFNVRRLRIPASLPSAVVSPTSVEELQQVVRFAREHGIAVLPFGAGSGVLGAAMPVSGELILDLKALNHIVAFEPIDGLVTVQAGLNGAQLEAWLDERGWTTGHHPQSLHMSTVGGWVACRGAGQSSSRYGKIEDMVQGCTVVLPDSRLLEVRPVSRRSAGPSLKDLFVGSEGTLGVLATVTLRVWPKPQAKLPLVLAFDDLDAGFSTLRQIMQAELRPAVVRLYDAHETAHRVGGRAPFDNKPIMAILECAGSESLAALERDLSWQIARSNGAVTAADTPYLEWLNTRYLSGSVQYQVRDWYADTIEVTGRWSALPNMHREFAAAARAAHPQIDFGAHWSHAYPDGACEYMTMRLPPMPEDEAIPLLFGLADQIQDITLRNGGAISHHHGIGILRGYKLLDELGLGMEILQAIKDHLDPQGLFAPGKLGMPDRGGQR
jgi:alkyldihydroxyacetonephosphate synthase